MRTVKRNDILLSRSKRNTKSSDETNTVVLLRCCHQRPFTISTILAAFCLLTFFRWSNNDTYSSNLVLLDSSSSPLTSSANLALSVVDEEKPTDAAAMTKFDTMIKPVSCASQIANRQNDPRDPNRAIDEGSLPSKYVTKPDPKFWISLHAQNFDRMRWVHIMQNGNYYEVGITEQFRSILHQQAAQPGLVIDVGMNIGWFSLYSRAMGHNVVGFDPNPIMHTRVCESLKLNGWLHEKNDKEEDLSSSLYVKTFAYGLGSETTSMNLTTGNNPGGSSFLEDRLAKKFRRKLQVDVVRLDDVAEQEGWISRTNEAPPIYLWKLDVEGYEYHVLEGSQKLLNSGQVENIIMENSNKKLREVVDMYAKIYAAGYKIQMISDVQGRMYHKEMIPGMNAEFQQLIDLQKSSAGIDLDRINTDVVGKNIRFLADVPCNLWWNKRVKQ